PYSIVSRSRISPIRITSGAWRSVFLSAACHDSVSTPTSRWVMTQPLCGCTNSTGSSMVMMWPRECSLRWPIMAASVVDLPEPVPPTTITSPRLFMTTSLRIGGSSSSTSVGISVLIVRSTAPNWPCRMYALTRKRSILCGLIAKLHSSVETNSLICLSFMRAPTIIPDCSAVSGVSVALWIVPSILMAGGKPVVMKRSEPSFSTILRSRFCVSLIACSRSMTFSSPKPSTLERASRAPGQRIARDACSCRPVSCAPSKVFLVHRPEPRLFLGDQALRQQLCQVLVQRLHAGRVPGLDGRIHLGDLAFADQVPDGRRPDHDLVRGDAPAADALEQRLRDHRT